MIRFFSSPNTTQNASSRSINTQNTSKEMVPFNTTRIKREGWLEKQSRHMKRWKRRWIVLQDAHLYSFAQERVYENPTEVIDLAVFSSVKSAEDVTGRPHSFVVYSTELKFIFVAPSEADKESWIRNIGKQIVVLRVRGWQPDEEDEADQQM